MILGFEIASDYGHFSHPATIYSSLTYPLPPKTAVMGMLGAIAGLAKLDEYNQKGYECLNAIKYSIVIKQLKGKQNFCFNGVKNALPSIDIQKGVQNVKQRKQFYRELLVAPAYEIYADLTEVDDSSTVNAIKENLGQNRSQYQLYMGVNFCLASLKFINFFETAECKQTHDFVDIHSFIRLTDEFRIEPDKNYTDIRTATTVSKGRIFGGFTDLLVETAGKTIRSIPSEYRSVNGKNLVFI